MNTLESTTYRTCLSSIQHFPFRGSLSFLIEQVIFGDKGTILDLTGRNWHSRNANLRRLTNLLGGQKLIASYFIRINLDSVALSGPRDPSTCPLSSNKQALVLAGEGPIAKMAVIWSSALELFLGRVSDLCRRELATRGWNGAPQACSWNRKQKNHPRLVRLKDRRISLLIRREKSK